MRAWGIASRAPAPSIGLRVTVIALGAAFAAGVPAPAPALAGPAFEVSEVAPTGLLGSIRTKLLFSAETRRGGNELWISNGTDRGTRPLAEIRPGSEGGNPGNAVSAGSGRLVFMADDGVHGVEYWVTDGTESGTRLLADINPGPAGQTAAVGPVRTGGRILFPANDGTHGLEWWTTDGTPAGTRLVADINPGGRSSIVASPFDYDATPGLGMMFFTAYSEGRPTQLWRTDGTEQGTVPLEAEMGLGYLEGGAHDGHFYFADYYGAEGAAEIGRTDGTADGTKPFASPSPEGERLNPTQFSSAAGRLYFYAGVTDEALWVSDGTAAGTRELTELCGCRSQGAGEPVQEFDGRALFYRMRFSGEPPFFRHESELFTTDGTAAGTRPIRGVPEGAEVSTRRLDIINDTLVFDVSGIPDPEIYSVVGANGIARPVPSVGDDDGSLFISGTEVDGRGIVADVLYFHGITERRDGSLDSSLWKIDVGDSTVDAGEIYIPSRQAPRARRNLVRVAVTSRENVRVRARGEVRIGSRWRPLRGQVKRIPKARRGRLRLAARSRRDWRRVRRRVESGRGVPVRLRLITRDDAGNRKKMRKRVRLR